MPRWDEAAKAKQSQMIKRWQPWQNSTGATTAEGQERSRSNAYKHGRRCESLDPFAIECRNKMDAGDHASVLSSLYEFILKSYPELADQFGEDWQPKSKTD